MLLCACVGVPTKMIDRVPVVSTHKICNEHVLLRTQTSSFMYVHKSYVVFGLLLRLLHVHIERYTMAIYYTWLSIMLYDDSNNVHATIVILKGDKY